VRDGDRVLVLGTLQQEGRQSTVHALEGNLLGDGHHGGETV